ncbi:MAG: transposase [Candidatus Omnitrophica bacterium]|nr:transposase [Candidatus Omnitrophota bacterium]
MPRIARLTMDNTAYHIITRGNQKQCVFREPADYEKYLYLLQKYKQRFKAKLYCFCLMPNHIHLLMDVPIKTSLNKIMRGLNLSYTRYFNEKYNTVGHLWQDRFKSKIIQKDSYLLQCIEYVENNPVRASLVTQIGRHRWSSYFARKEEWTLLDNLFSI